MLATLARAPSRSQTLAIASNRFQSPPANVVPGRSSLHIDFDGTDGILAAVGALIYGRNNDFDRFRSLVEHGAGVVSSVKQLTV